MAANEGRAAVKANLGEQEVARSGRVDWQEGERDAAWAPLRDPGAKRRGRILVAATVELSLPEPEAGKLTLIGVHTPVERIERSWSLVRGPLDLGEIPVGDYVVIVEVPGHRPIATLAVLTRPGVLLRATPPLVPVWDPRQERELLRRGEVHPYADNVRSFLRRFGYAGACSCRDETLCGHVEESLRRFQRTYRLEITGSLTVETLRLMLRPRCGVPDVFGDEPESARADAGAQAGSGPGGTTEEDPIVFSPQHWDEFGLHYQLLTGTGDISNEWPIVRLSMQHWADASPLSFDEASTSTHLEFDFRSPGEEGYPFDEGGEKDWNVYAHGFHPGNGLVEFDDHEDWGDLSLEAVSTHEVGHALGLRHSSVEDAAMYAVYHEGQKSLKEVDIRGVKSLYAPVVRRDGPFIAYPLWAIGAMGGTDTVTIDLGRERQFLAWGTIAMIDCLIDFDRDNMCFLDIFEVDGQRTDWRLSGGAHFGSPHSPANVHQGAFVGRGRTVMFRLAAGHVHDLEISGYALVLVLE